MRRVQMGVLAGLLTMAQFGWALGLTITRQEMVAAMQPFFPYPVQLGGWNVSLQNPDLGLRARDQSIALRLNMAVSAGGQTMDVDTRVRGKIAFDPANQQLQLVKPRIEHLEVVRGRIDGADDALQRLRDAFGRELPVIVLLDIRQLSSGFSMFSPSQIRVLDNAIEVLF